MLATPDGTVRQVAGDLAFPNGMAITPDGETLIVAESSANRLTAYDIGTDGGLGRRRVWAETPDDHPDGICIDAEGAVWYADMGNQHCVRVHGGGEVLATVNLDRDAFACALSRGPDPHLFVVGQNFGGPQSGQPSGQVVAFPAPAPGAGKPWAKMTAGNCVLLRQRARARTPLADAPRAGLPGRGRPLRDPATDSSAAGSAGRNDVRRVPLAGVGWRSGASPTTTPVWPVSPRRRRRRR